ncbi:hypothetical protein [Sphingomonas astaxanthinifaciens]|uniref:Uncharacterized protein n=1 Tax=Sphingomonas astaxanthinifaciens DSM 22298 TaxID=1123267 RepID=A0ABQ5Z5A1_9SPHN|nr:hypothetical protein [Sphingomonas astaxanthinifaciens]GLR46677.1 hypothetical protein GCM10007925_03880 [Sphingomonas astaxanthinifaciens DSM 22298]
MFLLFAALQAAAFPGVPADWRTRPINAGEWSWRSGPDTSEAVFSDSRGPQLVIRCTRSTRRVSFSRTGAVPGAPIRIATTSSDRLLTGSMVLASDPLLDAISFSRGRLWVDVQGTLPLVLRSAAEPARSIEDCRS